MESRDVRDFPKVGWTIPTCQCIPNRVSRHGITAPFNCTIWRLGRLPCVVKSPTGAWLAQKHFKTLTETTETTWWFPTFAFDSAFQFTFVSVCIWCQNILYFLFNLKAFVRVSVYPSKICQQRAEQVFVSCGIDVGEVWQLVVGHLHPQALPDTVPLPTFHHGPPWAYFVLTKSCKQFVVTPVHELWRLDSLLSPANIWIQQVHGINNEKTT